jgi:hypothetical protein
MRERDIEAHLVKRVKAMGGEVRKVQWIGRRGAPDRLVMIARRDVRTGRFGTVCTFWAKSPSRTSCASTPACAVPARSSSSSTRWTASRSCWHERAPRGDQ